MYMKALHYAGFVIVYLNSDSSSVGCGLTES